MATFFTTKAKANTIKLYQQYMCLSKTDKYSSRLKKKKKIKGVDKEVTPIYQKCKEANAFLFTNYFFTCAVKTSSQQTKE
jgi:hypothetical protein